MAVSDQSGLAQAFEHEELNVFHDRETGLTGAVAVHSTVLGPAVGVKGAKSVFGQAASA